MLMVSRESGQAPLETVQTNKLLPFCKEFTTEPGEEGLATTADPETTDQVPLPLTGKLAFMVDEV